MGTRIGGIGRTLRYGRAWLGRGPEAREREMRLDRRDREVPATLFVPPGPPPRAGWPAWVVLHGITRPGRKHPVLRRFVRSLACSGGAVLVPEVPEWSDLDVTRPVTIPSVRAALEGLASLPDVRADRAGLVGFSFGAPQALLATLDDEMAERIAAVVAFGGYCDLESTFRFQMTGHHVGEGRTLHLRPDPYGRWIVAGNFLPDVDPALTDVAEALLALAVEAGERRVASWDPGYDPVKRALRERVAPARRELFDLFAPPSAVDPSPTEAEPWVQRLVGAAREVAPHMDPGERPRRVEVEAHLIHGRGDRLVPWTESVRMAALLAERGPARLTVTELFAHSTGARPQGLLASAREAVAFADALRRVLSAV